MELRRARFKFPAVLLSGVLITHHLSDEALGWFRSARDVVDELVAFVDERRATPGLDARLRQLDARIINTNAPEFFRADFAAMVAACRGEWLLKIDYDEELSPEWQDRRWREILAQNEFNHFWSPRRWLTSDTSYIASEPWWPDRQLRLFRNDPRAITFPTRLHETMQMNGEGAYLRTLAIHHHDLRLASRSARERKAAEYERQRPGNGLGFFYLPEDYKVRELPVPIKSDFDPAREILRMPALDASQLRHVAISCAAPPKTMRAGELTWLNTDVTNGTQHGLSSGTPFPLNLAYHWLDAASQAVTVFDGERTALLPEIPPGETHTFQMFIVAPAVAGEYLLRIAIVQEKLRWMDEAGSPTTQDFTVTVT